MTPLVCQLLCSGYRYAGVEYGTQCYCGNSFDNGATGSAIPESSCPFQCGGDPSQKCGGDWTLSLYGKPAPPPPPPPPPPTCADNSKAVPFLRAYNPTLTDHFYTTSAPELDNAVKNLGYANEGSVGRIWTTQQPGTVPLYRLYSDSGTDHFYTTSAPERDNAVANLGYKFESTAGFVYPAAMCGAVPLYRLYSPSATDHFYTPSASERGNAANSLGYSNEGVAGYILG
ncbi:hypothetical protein BD779DRAFT_612568 [Infundibulicybe gibba]|nr:hypothetical protein BD779DRAFT_612568 [Infundibulicybe gibba]